MCISIFASHFVLGKNLIYKILIPSLPFVIIQLTKYGVGQNSVLLLIFVATIILVISMYKNIFYQFRSNQLSERKENNNSVAFMTTGLSHKHLDKINGFIGVVISKWIINGKKNLDWAVLLPHTRLAIITIFYSFVTLFFMSISDPKIQKLTSLFALMVLPNIFLGFVMESKNLLNQVKLFGHVFNGANHRQLKNKILLAMDKNMLFNTLVFACMFIMIIKVLSINVLITPLVISMALVAGISLAICPLMMCLNWNNISVFLIVILFVYGITLYKMITWIYANTLLAMSPFAIIGFIGVCLLFRFATQNVFWNRPMEALLKR